MAQPNLPHLLSQAIAHHQSGRLQQAAELYQQILAQNPRHADALRLLGVIAHRFNRHDAAAELLRQAIAVNASIPEYHNDLALALHALGRLDDAAAEFRVALKLNSQFAEAHYNLANLLKAQSNMDDAIAAYQQALRFRPYYSEASNNLGNALIATGKIDEAISHYRQAVRVASENVDARINLAKALQQQGHFAEAVPEFRAALQLRPDDPHANFHMADALQATKQFDDAIAQYRIALLHNPHDAAIHNNLGTALMAVRRPQDAAACFRMAARLNPQSAEARSNLGNAFKALDRLDEAVAEYRAALVLNPAYAQALTNLGSALKDQGLLDESLACLRQAAALDPGNFDFASNLIYMLHFDPNTAPQQLAAELAHWNNRFADVCSTAFGLSPPTHPNPTRPLRIGFTSPDFRHHPIGRFLLPLFAAHDQTNFPFYCYSDVTTEDALTAELRSRAHQWHNTATLSHEALASLIASDHIDILIDLTMHMQGSRLPVFARKPAPIQMTYLAYCASTGMKAIDYRLTDRFLDPPDNASNQTYIEKSLHLNSYWCYLPDRAAPEVNALPAGSAGHVTFGNLNNLCKASPPVFDVWIQILRAVPNAQILLHAPPGSARERIAQTFATCNIDPARCRFAGLLPFDQYMQLYHQIDIALDPFPYAGGTTSCDALWMGVPLITLAGGTGIARGGVSLLSHLGLHELVAADIDGYVSCAVQLAGDLTRLSDLRAGLRARMAASPLMDAAAFAADFQQLCRRAWMELQDRP